MNHLESALLARFKQIESALLARFLGNKMPANLSYHNNIVTSEE